MQWTGPIASVILVYSGADGPQSPRDAVTPSAEEHRVHKAISASGYTNPTVTRIWMLLNNKGILK